LSAYVAYLFARILEYAEKRSDAKTFNRQDPGKIMRHNPEKHHRCSIRLKDYDYAQAGAYFITICTKNRECLFAEIIADEMSLNNCCCFNRI